jgi:hypothetical protein
LVGVSLGTNFESSKYFFKPSINRAMTDTGTYLLGLPMKDYENLAKYLCDYLENENLEAWKSEDS